MGEHAKGREAQAMSISSPAPVSASSQHRKRLRDTPADGDNGDVPSKRPRTASGAQRSTVPPLQQLSPVSTAQNTQEPPLEPAGDDDDKVSLDDFVRAWLDTVGGRSYRRQRSCRSESGIPKDYARNTQQQARPRRRTKSESEAMAGVRRDADGFVIPPQRTSSRRQSAASDSASLMSDGMSVSGGGVSGAGASSSGSRRPSLVERGRYRVYNLYLNGIQFRDKAVAFPPSIARLIADMGRNRAERGDAGRPTKDELWNNKKLGGLEMGAEEPVVEDYFKEALFPDSDFEKGLMRATRQPMVRGRTPGRSQLAKVSNPIPDLLYGYSDTCFVAHAAGYSTVVDNVTANNQDMSLPFLAVEFKGDGPGGTGSLWVATNQCLGDSAACVNMAEHVFKKGREKAGTANTERDKDERTAHSAAFSIAMNGTEARLYVTWVVDGEGDGVFCMQKVDSFLMQKPADYLAFRDYVLNIVDWGQTTRLERFRAIFDMLSS